MSELQTIVELSHEFGSPDYVRGGGGNTSTKDSSTLWVKPSGTTLGGLTAETFVAMDRQKINALYEVAPPTEPAAREELVKDRMAAACVNDAGRPSVEAPLHNVFHATLVVHTHPAWVNGLTCARDGEAACQRLFPDALWVEYIDPGYTLCMEVRERIAHYEATHGHQPELLLLKNHGLFVAANTAAEIRALHARIMATLECVYTEAGMELALTLNEGERDRATEEKIGTLWGADAAYCVSTCEFDVAPGPITPDHVVYAKAFPFAGELTEASVAQHKAERGYAPRVVIAGSRVYGIGTSQKNASLALEFAQDGALVMRLADAFGGINYMTDAHRLFIENWEVEAYRQTQV
ncbi:MAG: class II aldolase [Lentisphaerae bacterium]|nr:class II aldolase [Lentisphaerota bacterium]